MDDKDYVRQISQMCKFIKQEAQEKSNEIMIKTQHDFNLEKQMMVHSAKLKLQQDFKRKEKELETQKRIDLANAIGKARVKKMRSREDLIQKVKDAAVIRLAKEATSDKKGYAVLVKELITQGLVKLNERDVEVIVREEDLAIAKEVAADAGNDYVRLIKEATSEDVKVNLVVNESKFLPAAPKGDGAPSCAGGVKLIAHNGRIVCDNTLDSRLRVAFDDLMPAIRSQLFQTKV